MSARLRARLAALESRAPAPPGACPSCAHRAERATMTVEQIADELDELLAPGAVRSLPQPHELPAPHGCASCDAYREWERVHVPELLADLDGS